MDEMVSNICRPFVLCNDFIPPTSNQDYKWRYLSWGYFDGIHVGENLFKENKVSLENLDNFYQEQSKELNGSYSTQIIYGVCTEPFSKKAAESVGDFDFGEDTNFEELLNQEGNSEYKAITYLTLDNSDMILVIRSKNYSTKLVDKQIC